MSAFTGMLLGATRKNGLVLWLIGAIFLAWLTPGWGAKGGVLHTEWLTKIGVFVIFLLQGFGLAPEALRRGLGHWRLHLFMQGWIFLGIPLMALGLLALAGERVDPALARGLFFLAILPTTVSSAVAFIAQADGNAAAGVFNTALANLAGILLVPTWMLWFEASVSAVAPDVWPIFRSLLVLLLLPFVLGQVAHRFLPPLGPEGKKRSRITTQGIIVFMVYAAFANSFRDALWARVGADVAWRSAAAAGLLLLLASLCVLLTARLSFRLPGDRVAAFFCGSHKSLAVGIPFAAAIFGTGGDAGLVILPLLFYHPLQLFLGALLLRWQAVLFR